MTVKITKPSINVREKLSELDKETGIKGEELLRADTSAEAREALQLDQQLFTDFESTGIDDNATSTAVTIDSSGNLLVGKTASGSTAGGEIRATGQGNFRVAGSNGLLVDRKTDNGDLVVFQKDGTTVGSIGTKSGDPFISNVSAGIKFTNEVEPCTNNGENADTFVDLGSSSNRFGSLYLSGGVYLGGTTSANKLDDYEEGTFTPVYSAAGLSVTHDSQSGAYTKIGNTVFFRLFIGTDVVSGGGASQLTITGLPYAANGSSSGIVGLAYTFNASENDTKWVIVSGQAAISFYTGTSNGAAVLPSSALATYNNTNRLYMSGTYTTT